MHGRTLLWIALMAVTAAPVRADSLTVDLFTRDSPFEWVGTATLTVDEGIAIYEIALAAPTQYRIDSLAFNSLVALDPGNITVDNLSPDRYFARAGGTDHFGYDVFGPLGLGLNSARVRISGLGIAVTTANFLLPNQLIATVYDFTTPFGVGLSDGLGHTPWAYTHSTPTTVPEPPNWLLLVGVMLGLLVCHRYASNDPLSSSPVSSLRKNAFTCSHV